MKTRFGTITIATILALRFLAALVLAPQLGGGGGTALAGLPMTPFSGLVGWIVESGMGGLAGGLQALAGIGTVWLMFRIARDFSPRAGRTTFIIGSLFPGMIIADVNLIAETFLGLAVTLTLFMLHRWLHTRTWRDAALTGLAHGLSLLINPIFTAWAFVAAAIVLVTSTNRADAWRTVRHLALALLIAALCVSPWVMLHHEPAELIGMATWSQQPVEGAGTLERVSLSDQMKSSVSAALTPISIPEGLSGGIPYRLAGGMQIFVLALFGFGLVLMPKLLRGTGVIDHRDQALDRLSAICAGAGGEDALVIPYEEQYGVSRPDHSPSHHALNASAAWLLASVAVYFLAMSVFILPEGRVLIPGVPAIIIIGAIGLDELLTRLRAPHV